MIDDRLPLIVAKEAPGNGMNEGEAQSPAFRMDQRREEEVKHCLFRREEKPAFI